MNTTTNVACRAGSKFAALAHDLRQHQLVLLFFTSLEAYFGNCL